MIVMRMYLVHTLVFKHAPLLILSY